MALLALCAAKTAHAQDQDIFRRDRNIAVTDRPQPEYDPLGLQVGSFLVFPKLTSTITDDDNIFATANGNSAAGIVDEQLQVTAQSNWSRNLVLLKAKIDRQQYLSFSEESTTSYELQGFGRLDLDHASKVSGNLDYQQDVEPRSDETAPTSARTPVQYSVIAGDLNGYRDFSRFRATLDGSFDHYDYTNSTTFTGATLEENQRNVLELKLRGQADYALSPNTSVYVALTGNDRDYDIKPPVAPYDPGSSGYELLGGASFDLTRLVRGKIEVGYLDQHFVDRVTPDMSGPTVHGNLQYFPTELTTVSLKLSRDVDNSGLILTPAYLANSATLKVDHELLRNVILTASGSMEYDTFGSLDRLDRRIGATAGVVYKMNRSVNFDLTYTLLKLITTGAARGTDFNIDTLAFAIVLQR
ncbi:outer membrane beta-barrel protein [Caulobacter sp. S45]|uniref:outer membrane beta-barrel protein n=1 Tax=Caulobacter sp. S45 TaxID=1641861 RepID=UPI00131E2EE4|nr:outer membrane beta-barrel protein [Caulobacter sp. S45]